MLPGHFIEFLHDECQVTPGMRILVGVSGGADSICLLDLLRRLGFPIVVAHFNHQIRKDAEDDLLFVQNLASSWNVPFVQGEGNVRDFARKNKKTLEEAARICRYDFLKNEAARIEIGFVAVAHTATDQAETILMHLLRGCGLDGLQGMLPVTRLSDSLPIRLIRPLLSVWKKDVLTYCAMNNLEYREDYTNLDPGYFRNRLRLQLMPSLREYNPGIEKHLINLGNISHRELSLINQLVMQAYQQCLIEENPAFIALSRAALLKVENGMLQRLLLHTFHKLMDTSIELDFDMAERMARFVRKPNSKNHLSLLISSEMLIEGDILYFHHRNSALPFPDYPFMESGSEFIVDVPTMVKLNEKWTLRTSLVPTNEVKFTKKTSSLILTAYLDAEKISWPMILKSQQPGTRFQPLGLQGQTQKLSDFWINKKIPSRFRSTWPLLFNKGEVACIIGLQPTQQYQITGETRMAVKIELEKQ
jgi:tRNA(Ile)-lysidine synthase